VFSSAIGQSNPEIQKCKELSIPLVSRAEMLAELMRNKNAIAIAGSHGKTTTTSLVGTILENAKLDPTIINGGIINAYSKNNRMGLGKWIVVEADESDGSFLRLPHKINIITNIDIEHLDYYKTKSNLVNSFQKFITNLPFDGCSIICIDNNNLKKLSKKIKTRKIISYAYKDQEANVKILEIEYNDMKSKFSIHIKKNTIPHYSGIFKFYINLLGIHNVLNATSAIIAAMLLRISIKNIQKSLETFKGVERRFTFLGKIKKSFIYDDYAHHPTEIKASYEIAKHIAEKKIIVLFQPHRFSRTRDLYSDFIKVLNKIDILYVLDIYAAGENSIKKINSKNIVKDLREKKQQVFYISKNEDINKILSSFYDDNNLIVFMGAGSITHKAHKLIKENNVRKNFRDFKKIK
jgi:UDP-N-acetylmuramate--alanine ligase